MKASASCVTGFGGGLVVVVHGSRDGRAAAFEV